MDDTYTADNLAAGEQTGEIAVNAESTPKTFTSAERVAFIVNSLRGGSEAGTEETEGTASFESSPEEVQEEATEGQEEVGEESGLESRSVIEVPDKFKNPDGTTNLSALVKSYLFAEKKISEQGQELSQLAKLQQEISELKQLIANELKGIKIEKTEATDAHAKDIENLEDIDFDKDEFLEEFYENPIKALMKWEAKREQQRMAQLAKQEAEYQSKVAYWQNRIQEVAQQYPDFYDLLPVIQEIVNLNAGWLENAPNAIETAYWTAKGLMAQQFSESSPKIDLDSILDNDEFVNKLVDHPKVKKAVLNKYTQTVKDTAKVPTVIANQPGASQVVSMPMEIKSTKDAAKASVSLFRKLFGE